MATRLQLQFADPTATLRVGGAQAAAHYNRELCRPRNDKGGVIVDFMTSAA